MFSDPSKFVFLFIQNLSERSKSDPTFSLVLNVNYPPSPAFLSFLNYFLMITKSSTSKHTPANDEESIYILNSLPIYEIFSNYKYIKKGIASITNIQNIDMYM